MTMNNTKANTMKFGMTHVAWILVILVILLILYNLEINVYSNGVPRQISLTHPMVTQQVALQPNLLPMNTNTNTNTIGPQRMQSSNMGFPKEDEYMSKSLKTQLEQLHQKFYYDNCRYAPTS